MRSVEGEVIAIVGGIERVIGRGGAPWGWLVLMGLLVHGVATAPCAEATESEPPARALSERSPRARLHCEPPTLCCPGPPVYGYDGRLFVRDRCSRFTFEPGVFTQLRWTLNERTSVPPGETLRTHDLDFARTRILLQGQATRLFDYDVRLNIDHQGDVDPLVWSLALDVGRGWSVKAGKMFITLTREDWVVADSLLATEFSANDEVFSPGTGRGVEVSWTGRRSRAWGALSDGEFKGGQHLVDQTGNASWALTGRFESQLLTEDWSLWDDLVGRPGRACGVLLGLGGGIAEGKPHLDVERAYLLTGDVSLNWSGGQALVYGNVRREEWRDGTTANTWGLVAQAGQFVTCTIQLYGRYEVVSPGNTPGDLATYQAVALGCNVLPFRWTNRLKLAGEFSYLFAPLSKTIVPASGVLGFLASEEEQFYVRVQLQLGI